MANFMENISNLLRIIQMKGVSILILGGFCLCSACGMSGQFCGLAPRQRTLKSDVCDCFSYFSPELIICVVKFFSIFIICKVNARSCYCLTQSAAELINFCTLTFVVFRFVS